MQALIVDDDPLICDLLEHFCKKTTDISTVTTTNSGFESVNLLNRHHFNVVFLDYNLPDFTGKEILNIIPMQVPVIMITSHSEFAAESYNYDQIVDYLMKPIDYARFQKSVQKAKTFLSHYSEGQEDIFVRDGTKLVKIKLMDIQFVKAEANYISLVTKEKKILTLMTLKEFEKKLPNYFQRVHRSYIVNLRKIDSIESSTIRISDFSIPVSESYEKTLIDRVNLLN